MRESILSILDQNPTLLKHPESIIDLPVKIALQISLMSSEMLKMAIEKPELIQLSIESISIVNRFKKNKIIFNQLKDQVLLQTNPWATKPEMEDVEKEHFSIEKKINETEISESLLWKYIEKIRSKSFGLLNKNDIIMNDHFVLNNPQDSLFIKKKVLDQISFEMFQKINLKFNQLFSFSKIEKDHFLQNEQSKVDKSVIFAYINMNKMESPKVPRFGSVFDPYEVKNYEVKSIYHRQVKSRIPIQVNGLEVIVNCDVWLGNIICEE